MFYTCFTSHDQDEHNANIKKEGAIKEKTSLVWYK